MTQATPATSSSATPPLPNRPASRGALHACRAIAGDIKLAHSVFALPFALLGAFMAAVGMAESAGAAPALGLLSTEAATAAGAMAAPGLQTGSDWVQFGGQLLLVICCMVSARTVAMIANRIFDRKVDARNPRTARRALPSGQVSVRSMALTAIVGAGFFIFFCAGFALFYGNWWPLGLSVPVLMWISAYPLLKRFTALCHLYLGSALAISPLAAALAIDPAALANQPALWLLSVNVMCWVAGFDVVYALQDVDIDRREGLHSLPGRLGGRNAMRVSRALHAVSVASLIAAWWVDPRLGWLFALGVAATLLLIIVEHLAVIDRSAGAVASPTATGTRLDVRPSPARVQLAFFTLNGVISCILGLLGIASLLIAGA